jgi:hypothetical protein
MNSLVMCPTVFRSRTRLFGIPLWIAAAAIVGLACGIQPSCAADPSAAPRNPWTLEDAKLQLRLYPRDVYLQYVTLMLERQAGVSGRGSDGTPDLVRRDPGRGVGVDLFNLFSGASAVQESLQLDTMRGDAARGQTATQALAPSSLTTDTGQMILTKPSKSAPRKPVKLADLKGLQIQSHPWQKMLHQKILNGRKPQITALARCVPADFYFIEFHSPDKLLGAIEASDLWGRHLFSQTWQEARSQLFAERLKQQLAVETNPLLRPFYNAVVSDMAVSGSDLYAREGSDVTLLFRFKQPELFQTRMNSFLTDAAKSHADARRSEGEHQGVRYVEVSTPDRSVHVFSAYPEPDLHIRSNSRHGLERVIDAIKGKDAGGQAVIRLGDTDEFAYIRTLMPEGAPEEDGFIYLSDPFIRRLIGSQVKITERRRMTCYNHLRMIGHAALFHQTQYGKKAASLAELAAAQSSPGEFGKGKLVCPDGGTYTLSPDGLTAKCSHHGHAHSLIPCCEIPLTEVTFEEADQYRQFLSSYNQYWRTYFDPIAIRLQVRPERYRIETIILPLIDNSVYSTLAQATSGPPSPLDALPVPKRNIFSAAVRLNKVTAAKMLGVEELLEMPNGNAAAVASDTQRVVNHLKHLTLAWHNHHAVFGAFPLQERRTDPPNSKRTGLSWRVTLLPYLDEAALYKQFHLDEPWDSPHNKALISHLPEVYRPANAKLAALGKTKVMAPVGDQLITRKSDRPTRFADITDGTSNTIQLVETDDEHAVTWTKPDDLNVDLAKPLTGLAIRPPGGFLVAMSDGSVHFLHATLKPEKVAGLLTRAGGEPVSIDSNDELSTSRAGWGILNMAGDELLRSCKIGEFLTKGIEDEIGVHLCDADPLFDFSLPAALGQALGNFNGPDGFSPVSEELLIGLVVAALQSPIYISVPVRDVQVVDAFLDRLDRQLALLAHKNESLGGFFEFGQDFYRLRGSVPVRTYAVQFGPIKWRVFWARIGKGLYITSKPYILQEIATMESAAPPRAETSERMGHGMLRIRASNWNRVIASYKLGWAENNRAACLHNLGPLSSLVRAGVAPGDRRTRAALPPAVLKLGEVIYDTHFYCPEGGRYIFAADGTVTCSLHRSAGSPHQPDAPSPSSALGKLLNGFADMTVLLTFREEGLHAVMTVDRKRTK